MTKLAVLQVLVENPMTSREIASALSSRNLELSVGAIRMAILRCKKWGLIHADSAKLPGTKELRYIITEKGKKRLEWIVKNSEKQEDQ
jgi:DNA-binding PadR family transcriptional regulator